MKLVSIQSLGTIMLFSLLTSCDSGTTIYNPPDSCLKIPHPREFFHVGDYSDGFNALVSEIKPDKNYDYWIFSGNFNKEFGNKKLRSLINTDSLNKSRKYHNKAFAGVKDGIVEYYGYESVAKFIGKIDNVTEAFLIAESYGYTAHKFLETDHYYIENGNYILRLSLDMLQCQDCVVEVTVTKDGLLKSRFIEEIK